MKTAESKTAAISLQRKSSTAQAPFFQKEEANPFFSKSELSPSGGDKEAYNTRRPFFNPKPTIQTKLTIGQPNDQYEKEADSVADRVVQRLSQSTPSGPTGTAETAPLTPAIQLSSISTIQRKCSACEEEDKQIQEKEEEGSVQRKPIFESGAEEPIQRKCASCGKELEPIQRKSETSGASTASSSLESQLSSSRGGGTPLSKGVRSSMESAFGADFSSVRIHTDSQAVQMNKELNAQAFTHGSDIYFNSGKYNTNSSSGQHLLAHELTHTVQQGGGEKIQRQEQASTTSVELCFVGIRRFHLHRVGGVHAVINVVRGQNQQHLEVNPMQDQGVEDPAAVGEGPGRAAGLHSHVVIARGTRSAGTCQTISATPEQAVLIIEAANRYEDLDVVYEPPGIGPNSNSFAEWVLNEAGIDTTAISVPTGALGWGWYQDHPSQRSSPPRVARTFRGVVGHCSNRRAPANSFQSLVDLVRDAEAQLIDCGITDVGERVHIFRGIYYGTPWSKDFGTGQRSHIRNQMFNVYTGSSQPRYPMECLDCAIFIALGNSQDVRDPRTNNHVDVGHLFIGMDARRSWSARNILQPVGQVTGLEAATWAGDLGGGAAQLAMRRLSNSATRAGRYFRGSDYGGSINLEGDIAGYAVAHGGFSSGSAPTLEISGNATIATALEDYFFGDENNTAGWNSRCLVFITAMGGEFDSNNRLTNRSDVLDYLSEQIHDFGCWYMVNFQRQHHGMDAAVLERASRHMVGASAEIAEMFLTALENCVANPSHKLESRGVGPTPTAPGDTSCLIARAVPEGGELLEEGRQALEEGMEVVEEEVEELIEDAGEAAEEFEDWVDRQRRRVEDLF